MAHAPSDLLDERTPAAHAVRIYIELDELSESVATYLARGFDAGSPGVVVATPEHWRHFMERLSARGYDVPALERTGLLTVVDADATLRAFMVAGQPLAAAFEEVVGGLINGVAERFPGRTIHAFGEMVDLLCERGRPDAAAALEDMWNELALTRNFSLLCGYRLDIFDRDSQISPMPDVCRAHSHVEPVADPLRLARAVDLALEEVLGLAQAGQVYMLLGEQAREERVPLAQLALMWVSANLPVRADRVLERARAHYHDGAHAFATG